MIPRKLLKPSSSTTGDDRIHLEGNVNLQVGGWRVCVWGGGVSGIETAPLLLNPECSTGPAGPCVWHSAHTACLVVRKLKGLLKGKVAWGKESMVSV